MWTNWMPKLTSFKGPPGLESLSVTDHIFLQERIEERRAFSKAMRYWVKNKNGETIYRAETDEGTDAGCCSLRATDMEITNDLGVEVIHLSRRDRSCFEPTMMSVYAPVGEIIGYVVEESTCDCNTSYVIQNASGENYFRLTNECCPGGCSCSWSSGVDFKLVSLDDDVEVGRIQKGWAGVFNEIFVNRDDYDISFPMDLDVRMKAVLLGACALISYIDSRKRHAATR